MAHVLNNDLFDDVKDLVTEALHSIKCLFKKNHAWQFESVRNLAERMMSGGESVDPVLSLSNLWHADTISTLHNLRLNIL